ncbi:MAG: proline dehydrogenase family protein [Bacteroidetes bacterium]|nr:proline dehydrogenase family protein [Bacteroidota bacterium]
MNFFRSILLWASENSWMRYHVPRWGFVKSAVKKFMPGEHVEDSLEAAAKFRTDSIPTVFTRLGENITELSEGLVVRDHYLDLIDKISERNLDIEISLKLTQLGFDLSFDETYERFKMITQKVKDKLGNVIWIDMESSAYTEKTIEFYKKIKQEFSNVGLCVQAYLYRTKNDLDELFKINPHIRLVKGAYKEPHNIAFAVKNKVDQNYFELARTMLHVSKGKKIRTVFGTHDENLISKISHDAEHIGIAKDQLEFHMLYGIKPGFQKELVKRGNKLRVLVSYGEFWYPWYMRRLAERPANVWFVLKNIF